MFNERMGNEICVGIENQEKEESKKSLKYFDRDCEAKQEILTVSLNHPNGLKLNQLYNLCDYKGKLTTFKSNLSKYANGAVTENGRRIIKPELQYVNRIGKRGSYRYILNDNGVQKAINDPLYYRRKQREEHEEWENQYIQHHFVNTEGDGSHSIQVVEKPVGRDLGDENDRPADDKSDETTDKLNVVELKRQLAEKDSTIEKLKDEKSDLGTTAVYLQFAVDDRKKVYDKVFCSKPNHIKVQCPSCGFSFRLKKTREIEFEDKLRTIFD